MYILWIANFHDMYISRIQFMISWNEFVISRIQIRDIYIINNSIHSDSS